MSQSGTKLLVPIRRGSMYYFGTKGFKYDQVADGLNLLWNRISLYKFTPSSLEVA